MYVIAKTTKLKKTGQIYKEDIVDKHYKKAAKVEITPKMVLVTYREAKGCSGEIIETTEAISIKDAVGISIYE